MTILSWYENYGDDSPPREIWHDHKKIEAHMANIRKKWGGSSHEEAPEGTLADHEAGKNVTLRNRLVDQYLAAIGSQSDDFDEI